MFVNAPANQDNPDMTSSLSPKLILSTALIMVLQTAWAQDSMQVTQSAEEIMRDVLDLNDPVLSVWPDVNTVEIEVFSASVTRLHESYEAERLDADERTREIEAMIAEARRVEDIIKDDIKAAKEADDDVEKDRLEDLKDLYEMRRKYLERMSRLRAEERKLSESRIDYVSQLSDVLGLAKQFIAARQSNDRDELLGTERELIRQSKELGGRLNAVAGHLRKVNTERDRAFEAREDLISAAN
jgi:hypothetical protein